MLKIVVTNIGFGDSNPNALKKLKQLADVDLNTEGKRYNTSEMIEVLQQADIVIAGTEPLNKQVLGSVNKLKLIARLGVGLDSVDLHTAKEKGIFVCYTPEPPAVAVAELTVSLMLALIKNIPNINQSTKCGEWVRPMGRNLSGMNIGLIGLGRVARQVIDLLQGFKDIHFFGYDSVVKNITNVEITTLSNLLQQSDLVSLHVPLTEQTKNLLNLKMLNLMKPDSYIINTARGGIIDEEALYYMLQNKKIAGAALDVLVVEPPKMDNP